jgi:hypothetical protein
MFSGWNARFCDLDSKWWQQYFPLGFLALGIFLRLGVFFNQSCLWQDEAWVALDLLERPVRDILFSAGDYCRPVPVGFAASVKLISLWLGFNELTLRLLPLVCGILSVVVYDRLLRVIASPPARSIALAFFAVAALPVYYAADLKHYSCDLLAALVLSWAALEIHRDPRATRRWVILIAVGVLAPWFSFASVFVMAAVMLLIAQEVLRSPGSLRRSSWVTLLFVWFADLTVLYFISFRKVSGNLDLKGMLHQGFPGDALSWGAGPWLWERIGHFLSYHGLVPLFFWACAAVGAIVIFKSGDILQRYIFRLLVAMTALAVAAGLGHAYPLFPRFQLFLLPFLIWVMAEGAGRLVTAYPRWSKITVLLVAAAWLCSAGNTWEARGLMLLKPDMRGALEIIRQEHKPGDQIAVDNASQWSYSVYNDYSYRLGLNLQAIFLPVMYDSRGRACECLGTWLDDKGTTRGAVIYPDGHAEWHMTDISGTAPPLKGRTWVIVSDTGEYEKFLLRMLDRCGQRIGGRKLQGMSLYLYDFKS